MKSLPADLVAEWRVGPKTAQQRHIFDKLDVSSRTAAVTYAIRAGLA